LSTVQYGGVSKLCLGVLKHLKRLKISEPPGASIDAACLGGRPTKALESRGESEAKTLAFWAGGKQTHEMKRVYSFLRDLQECCEQIVRVMKPRGTAIFVVARRTVGG